MRFFQNAYSLTCALNVTESDKICAVAHIITYWLQKEIDNSHREK